MELRFRAWDGEKLRYDVTGFEHGNGNEMEGIFLSGNYYKIGKDSVIEQYTGLKDRNGKRIYEGDIIRFFEGGEKERIEQIIFDDECCEYAITNTFEPFHKQFECQFEVIGNIHENKDLLCNNT